MVRGERLCGERRELVLTLRVLLLLHLSVEQYVGDISELVKKARKSSSKMLKEDPNIRKQALQKYLRENPDVKHKMEQAKTQFFEKYGHAPQSDKQNQEYHDLMKKYVGHIDIDVKKILGKGAIKTQKAHQVEDKFVQAQRKINKIQKIQILRMHQAHMTHHMCATHQRVKIQLLMQIVMRMSANI